MYSCFFEDEENFRKGPVLICLGAGKSFMDRKKLDRTIEEYAADYDARNMRMERAKDKNKCTSENMEKV